MTSREHDLEDLFPSWDLDGNGYIEFAELQQVLEACDRLELGKKERKMQAKLKASMADNGRIKPLGIDQFVGFMVQLFKGVPEEEWEGVLKSLRKAVHEAQSLTTCDRRMRVQWSLFRLLDVNQDGVVEFKELQTLINANTRQRSKTARKASVRWETELRNKTFLHGESLKLSLSEFHHFVGDLFKDMTDDQYVETMGNIERQLAETNTPEFHHQYIESQGIPELINSIVSYVLVRKPEDPLDAVIEYLEKQREVKA